MASGDGCQLSRRLSRQYSIVRAVLSGEIDVGLTNHYYLFRFLEGTSNVVPVKNYSPRGGGPGALVNIAGAGIVDTSPHLETAERFIEYLLSEEAQSYFATDTFEYPLATASPPTRSSLPYPRSRPPTSI